MAMSKGEREFWVVKIKQEITRKQAELLEQAGLTDDQLDNMIAQRLIEDRGITDQVERVRAIDAELKRMTEHIRALEREKRDIRDDLYSDGKLRLSYYDNFSPQNIATCDQNGKYRQEVLASLDVGADYIQLEKDKKEIEFKLMLITSGASVMSFVSQYLKKIGYNLDIE